MKRRESWIYLLAFLIGVVIVNLLGFDAWANSSLLNRYSLATLSFQGIVFEEFFLHVLLLRIRTVVGLWIFSKLVPKKVIAIGFAGIMCVMLGAIVAMAILANGVWGILFFVTALLPHGIFYGLAYWLWENVRMSYTMEGSRKQNYLIIILILMLTVIGSICEAYISPILVRNVIKI